MSTIDFKLCKTINLFDDEFRKLSVVNDRLLYDNKPVIINKSRTLTKNKSGMIELYNITTSSGENIKVVKKSGRTVEYDLKAAGTKRKSLSCDGIISYLVYGDNMLMPYADGDLDHIAESRTNQPSFNQIIDMVYVVSSQLYCLLSNGSHYFDLKPENCLYFCKSNTQLLLSLGDLGSVVSIDKKESVYVCTNPPRKWFNGFIYTHMNDIKYIRKTYTYLLINLILGLCRSEIEPVYFNSEDNIGDYDFSLNTKISTNIELLQKFYGLKDDHPLIRNLNSILLTGDINLLDNYKKFHKSILAMKID
jgi:hypothetical protein